MLDRVRQWRDLFSDLSMAEAAPKPARGAGGQPVDLIEAAARQAGIVDFLGQALAQSRPLLIAVNDTHRFTDTRSALEAVCRIASAENLPLRFRMVVATGSHVFDDENERRAHEEKILGSRASLCEARDWHDARDASSLKSAGGTRTHAWLADSSHALAIGSMEPHYFAGVTGAHKTLSVGLLGLEELSANHRHALRPEAAGLRLKGNPVYEGLARIIRNMESEGRAFFAINELLDGGTLSDCVAGHPLDCLESALPEVIRVFGATLDRPADIIVSVVDPPLDQSLYQADKGIKNVESAVRDGGVIVLDAGCGGGVGMGRFYDLLCRAPTHAEALALIEREGYALGDHKAVRLRALTDSRKVSIAAVAPGLSGEQAGQAGMRLFADRQSAARWALSRLGPEARGVIVRDAGNVTLRVGR